MAFGLEELTVAAVMSSPVVTIEAEASLLTARDLLHTRGVHHLLILIEGKPVAVVSDRDVLRALSPFLGTIGEQPRDSHTLLKPVFQVATYHPTTIGPEASVLEAASTLIDRHISCLPVVDERGLVIGIVTSNDLMRGLLSSALPDREASPLSAQ
ncbi:MAG: CBS domain-containing protein [Chloroflexota bacterium]